MKTRCAIIFLGLLSAGAAPTTEPATRPDHEDRRERFDPIIRKIEPSGHGDPARLPQYLDFFSREFVEDPRTFAFDVTVTNSTLHGYVEFAEHKESLANFLNRLGLTDIRDETELLPDASLGDKRLGVISAARTFVREPPHEHRQTLTECVQGDIVFLLKEVSRSELLCHTPDGYVGYIASADVRRVREDELTIPQAKHPIEIERVIATAQSLLGTKYVWGGVTKDGIDCSGLVRSAFRTVDINLPRDADQQYLVGKLVATRWCRAGLRRGDTLFFLGHRGNVHHTAIYLGDDQYIEAFEPIAKITSFRKGNPNYDQKRDQSFCFAKRILE